MTGEIDLGPMLATLTVTRRPGAYVFIAIPADHDQPSARGVEAMLVEAEGVTVVATVEAAEANGWSHDGRWAWLSLDVHSSLEAVGLTAAFATALAGDDLPCNVLAGYHHDHLLVPIDRADDAIACLDRLRERHSRLPAPETGGDETRDPPDQ
ncbi:MAG: ACT domain-containing protein [Acidimicrobiia bacterium]|nr:ACT domain-containing protein [Acidimicrobiia bacterium]